MRCNFGSIVLERKPLDFIWAKSACVQPDILIADFLGGMLFRVAPTKLHGSLSTDGWPGEVIGEDTTCDRSPIDEDLYSRGATGTVVGEEDMPPCAVQRQRSDGNDADRNFWSRILRWPSGRALFCYCLCFGFIFPGRFFLGFLLFRRFVGGQILLAQVLRRGIVERFFGCGLVLALSLSC